MAGPWSILRQRDFALLWCATAFSDLGTWMQIGALSIFVSEATGQARWTGIAGTVTYLCSGLLTPLGGVWVDRYDRRRMVAVASVLQALMGLLLALCFFRGIDSPFILVTLAGLQGLAFAVVIPALFAMMPDIVSKERVSHASFLQGVGWNAGRALGPVAAVMVITAHSYDLVFVLNALSYLVVAGAVLLLPTQVAKRHVSASMGARMRLGWREMIDNKICLWATAIALLEISITAPFIALIPAMSQLTLHGDSRDSAALFLAQGIGSAVGLVLIGTFMHRFGYARLLVGGATLLPVLLCVYALSPNIRFAILAMLPLTAVHSAVMALSTSLIQRFVADEVRGRVLALNRAATSVAYSLAAVGLGAVADSIGLRVTFVGMAMTTTALLVWFHFGQAGGLKVIALTDRPADETVLDLDARAEELSV